MIPLVWRKTSAYSIAAEGTDYAVSRSVVLDPETRILKDTFTAWHGPNLLDQPRETSRPASILGVRPTAKEAKALCMAHRDERHSQDTGAIPDEAHRGGRQIQEEQAA